MILSLSVVASRAVQPALDKQIIKLVFKKRGSVMVTIKYVQKMIKAARKVCSRTIGRRLGDAGLEWLRRRPKSLVPAAHKVSRLEWAAWVLGRTSATLTRWAFSDGTSFYLGRSENEVEQKTRGALGPFVWRHADGRDGLFEDCVGPSSYWKAQGMPVKIWGLLVAGFLFVWVLPQGKNMTGELYAWLVEHKFVPWLKKALGRRSRKGAFPVQDHERALWTDQAQEAIMTTTSTSSRTTPSALRISTPSKSLGVSSAHACTSQLQMPLSRGRRSSAGCARALCGST